MCIHNCTVPLTDQSYQSMSQSTLNSETETPVTEYNRLPSISVRWNHQFTVEPLYKDTPEMRTSPLIRTLSVVLTT